jgi:predicted AlkP superfamily pyrophosphatase or phosphodiesterase
LISLTDILPAALNSLDAISEPCALEIPKSKRVVVFLVDGLGFRNLENHLDLHPVASQILSGIGQATLPSTTPVSLASLGTGLNPGLHGFLGSTMYLAENDSILQPLKWENQPNPKIFQPEKTKFELAVSKYVEVNRIGPAAYENSGLTQAVLRGGNYFAAENLEEIVQVTTKCLVQAFPSLTYVYYRELDRVGHVHGVASQNWRDELVKILDCISKIQMSLGIDDQLVITADHGMVDIENRFWLEDSNEIWNATKMITGEPRFRHFYSKISDGKVLGRALERIQDIATVYSRDEFLASGLVGEVEPQFHSRVGDFVAIANGASALCSRTVDKRSSNLVGNHGGNSDTERDIPVAVLAR